MTTTETTSTEQAEPAPEPLFDGTRPLYADTVLDVLYQRPPTNPAQHVEAASALLAAAAHESLQHVNSRRYDTPEHRLRLADLLTRMADQHTRLAATGTTP